MCPYYTSLSRLPSADVVVVPYQYLLTKSLRRTLQISLKNAIVIFDEAHNLDEQCEQVFSFEMQAENYWHAFRYLERYSSCAKSFDFDSKQKIEQSIKLKCFLLRFINKLTEISKKANDPMYKDYNN